MATGLSNLYHRARLDKQARQSNGFLQITATIGTQIHHDSLYVLFLEFVDRVAYITCQAAIVRITCLFRIRVLIEAGHGYDAHLDILAITLDGTHSLFCSQRFHGDLVAYQADYLFS